jgi:outer membrane protein assembly factor BamB
MFIGLCAGCASTKQAQPAAAQLVHHTDLQSAAFQTHWEAQLPLRGGDTVDRLFLRDDNLYITTDLGEIYTLKADVGLLRWTRSLTKPDFTIYPPQQLQTSSRDGHVVIATTEDLWLFDRYSGEQIRRSPVPFPPAVGVVGDSTSLYGGGSNGYLYCYQWVNRFGFEPVELWRLATGAKVTTTPVLRNGVLYFGTQKGHVVSCSALDKAYGWSVRLEDGVVGDLAVDAGRVYAASSDRSLYGIHRGTGSIVWRARFPKPLEEGPVLKGAMLYQRCADLGLSAVDARDGMIQWTHPDAVAFLAESQGEVAMLRRGGGVDVVDAATGEIVRSIDTGPVRAAAVNTDDDALYLGYSDGRLVSLRMKESPYLRKQEVEAARALLNRQPPAPGTGASASAPAMPRETPDPLRSHVDRPN